MIIDATDLIIGRVATRVAKKALLGETIHIVNAEKAVITGKPQEIIARFKQKREMGAPLVGPYYPRTPERIVKRIIRGMLPYKKERGREALERVKCYVGVPNKFANEKIETIEELNVHNTQNKFITILHISKVLGAKTQ